MGTNAINTTQSTFTSGQLVSKNYVDNATTYIRGTAGDLGLRIVRGYVNRAGTTWSPVGGGFTVSRTGGAGSLYTITFSPVFTTIPVVTITPINNTADNLWVFTQIRTYTASSITISFANQIVSTGVDMEFNFIAIGTN